MFSRNSRFWCWNVSFISVISYLLLENTAGGNTYSHIWIIWPKNMQNFCEIVRAQIMWINGWVMCVWCWLGICICVSGCDTMDVCRQLGACICAYGHGMGVLCAHKLSLVPTSIGKLGKHFLVGEFWTHWKSWANLHKILEKSGNFRWFFPVIFNWDVFVK